ncbi:MAG: cytochrome c maturation protein CcmE [Planctomycetes bacterium]|nr:cytochrome c maturation protein CcmE [Planctomycetota bacterium]
MKLLIVALVFLTAVGVIVGVGLWATHMPVYTFEDLVRDDSPYKGGNLQLDDVIVVRIESRYPLRFTVAREASADLPIHVVSDLAPPENFDEQKPVMLRGTYDAGSRVFQAFLIATKCPSRYRAADDLEEESRAGSDARALGSAARY